jgi:glycosyltransferase involved in cell wall biosynthesis
VSAPDPFFSVLVTAYNRAPIVSRCLDSCLQQSWEDFEVVVVDDGSSDGTRAMLEARGDPRLRVAGHERNRGISAARATAVAHARGEWLVVVDSDWELFPHTLGRLREIVTALPGVHVVRSRLVWDDGHVTPAFVPEGLVDYRARLEWMEELATRGEGESDAGQCLHRSVFEHTPYFADRRGAMETLWELDLARREPSFFVPDVLGKQYADAPNSYLRGVSRDVVPRVLREAADMRWMAETALARHGNELARHAPRQHLVLVKIAAVQAFLAGDRRAGIRFSRASLREQPGDVTAWATLALGVLGPRAVAHGTLAYRRLLAARAARAA